MMRRGPLIAAGSILGAALVVGAVLRDGPLDEPCPTGDHSVPAAAVHLTPSLIRHQNWVGVSQTDLAQGNAWIYACTQGLIIGRRLANQVEFDPATGVGEVKVATRWVDLAWLAGALDGYRDPSRWTLVYTSSDPTSASASGPV